MTSPTLFAPRENVSERFPPHDESLPFRLTPTPVGNYRCPVSTPANYVPCTGKIRRTKPLQDHAFKQGSHPSGSQGRLHRPRLTSLARNNRPPRSVSRGYGGIDYYYVDKREDRREEQLTNTHWLKALCSQPVEEILGKYRRRTDFRRTHVTMMRACSTPGERSLLSAWENNMVRYPSQDGIRPAEGRGKAGVKSAMPGRGGKHKVGAGTSTGSTLGGGADQRATRSEPALSRAQRVSDSTASYALTPSTGRASDRSERRVRGGGGSGGATGDGGGRDRSNQLGNDDVPAPPATPVHRGQVFLMDEASDEGQESERKSPRPASSVRFVSFTTQLFRHTDSQGKAHTYSKMARGPEHLPYISNNKRVVSMIHNTNVYGKGATLLATDPDATCKMFDHQVADQTSEVNRSSNTDLPPDKNCTGP